MRTYSVALALVIAVAASTDYAVAFTPVSLTPKIARHSSDLVASAAVTRRTPRLGMSSMYFENKDTVDDEDDEEDEDFEDEDDDDDYLEIPESAWARSPFRGLPQLDPYNPNPIFKPHPSPYFPEEYTEAETNDDELVQAMTSSEREENLRVMRQLEKSDLPDLQERRDHAGYVEAYQELKKRTKKDPWFGVNRRIRRAVQLGEDQEKIDYLKNLAQKLGGPPPDVVVGSRGYAEHIEIFKHETSAKTRMNRIDFEVTKVRIEEARAMRAEMIRNEEKEKKQFEEDMRNPGLRWEREAKERREQTMFRLRQKFEQDNKKFEERAKEILGELPETERSLDDMIIQAREELVSQKKKDMGRAGDDVSAEGSLASKRGNSAQKAREAAAAEANNGRPRLPGDRDVTRGELGDMVLEPGSSTTTGPLTVEVTSVYNKEQSDPPMRKHCFQYTIRITNNSAEDTIQLLGRRFEIQTVGSSMKDVVQGEGVTGRQPILKPGEVFEYTSTAPLSVRPLGTTIIAARMRGEYKYITLPTGQDTATDEQMKTGGDTAAELGTFHFIFPEDQRVIPFRRTEDEDDEDDDDDDDDDAPAGNAAAKASPSAETKSPRKPISSSPASSVPGDSDLKTGDISIPLNESSDTLTEQVRVQVSSSYRPERSDAALEKHCFAYNIRITNDSPNSIQLVSRRFEIQTIGNDNKDVVQGPGVTGRQPILKPGESFEYTSTAPLNVKPMLNKTPAVARMQGEYSVVVLGDDGTTPISSTPVKAKLGAFHFILPSAETA